MAVEIRRYEPRDAHAVIRCISVLQDVEHDLESDRLPGAGIASAYFEHILQSCDRQSGRIFVAELLHVGRIPNGIEARRIPSPDPGCHHPHQALPLRVMLEKVEEAAARITHSREESQRDDGQLTG